MKLVITNSNTTNYVGVTLRQIESFCRETTNDNVSSTYICSTQGAEDDALTVQRTFLPSMTF